ncbi:unnamed protein product [Vitrella brassicaformis CCMP3155]|uniref:Uncharacterized protein n=1 Tax=Vitrella brassicaformis (strain CCMP3155) TaxID=1169540 RepID=A0A0G4GMI8_VITBC|nr:unnamed protein product [Vitrella brassicaformis CCMP3155]|eukprot:CEM31339.1 unnamed protein product [Vitrella brassicaformis CCMP3155]
MRWRKRREAGLSDVHKERNSPADTTHRTSNDAMSVRRPRRSFVRTLGCRPGAGCPLRRALLVGRRVLGGFLHPFLCRRAMARSFAMLRMDGWMVSVHPMYPDVPRYTPIYPDALSRLSDA